MILKVEKNDFKKCPYLIPIMKHLSLKVNNLLLTKSKLKLKIICLFNKNIQNS
mgnify:CR=1 FL=1